MSEVKEFLDRGIFPTYSANKVIGSIAQRQSNRLITGRSQVRILVGPTIRMDKLFVSVDGRARGEPGEAGIGIAITDKDGNVVEEVSTLVGNSTSKVAHYRALIEGCRHALAYSPQSVIFFTDNQDLVNQVNGVFETRQPHLKRLIEIAKGLLNSFPQWRVNYIDPEANRRAIRLVNRAFHKRIQAEITRERLELRLLARTSSLSEEDMERLIDYAEQLQSKD